MNIRNVAPLCAAVLIQIVGASWLSGQITSQINAHIPHSFIIDDKTLPPGDYTFRLEQGSNLGVMAVRNASGDNVAQFTVRESINNHRPNHSELVFNKYGDTEFLTKIYQGGSRTGVAVSESSKKELQLMNGGQHGLEHTEEQK